MSWLAYSRHAQVQYTSYYTFNVIVFSTQGGTSPANIPQAEHADDTNRARSPRPSFEIYLYSFTAVAVVAIAIIFLIFKDPSNPSLPLPAAVPIYGRNVLVREVIDKILLQTSDSGVKKHIALRGSPGMGKTTTGNRIMHHPRIARHFGKARHWVSCREASSIADDLKADKLIEYISDSLDLELSGSGDRRKDIRYFLNRNNVPRIIVLDNFETMWEPSGAQKAVEAVLAFLDSFSQLTILLTTRNAHDPAGVSWHEIEPIKPLSLDASRTLFTNSFSHTIDNRLDDLLVEVGRIPLLIVLMASYGKENVFTTSQVLEIWNTRLSERNETYKDNGDPMNILDLSIAMSLEGPLIKSTPDAPVLLRIIAGLPGGIRRENLKAIVPLIPDVDDVVAVLSRTSLVINSPDVWQVHSSIRLHMLRRHPLNASHSENIQAFYFQLIHDAGHDPGGRDFLQRAYRLSYEETNAQAILLDALEHNLSATSVSISTDYSNYLIWNTPSIDIPKRTVELIRKQPLTRDSLLPLPLLRLGALYFRLDNYPKVIEVSEEAMDRYKTLNQLNGVAQAQLQLAEIHRLQHEHTRAVQLYSLAYERFNDTEDYRGMAACLRGIGIAYFQDDPSSEDAVEMILKAQNTCLIDDLTCITDSERELGRVYRDRNTTESIRLLTKAREYHMIHGPRRAAAIASYQKSIAQYSRDDYDEAEVGLNEAYEEFKPLRNDAQMGYSLYHLAVMNRKRGSLRQALELYHRAGDIFEHMGNKLELIQNDTINPRMGNEFMVAISLECQAELYARLCQPDEAKWAYSSARALLDIKGRERIATYCPLDIQDIPHMCEFEIWRGMTFDILITLFLACVVLCLLCIHREWSGGEGL